ncbi:MAG: hypothetical protein HY028_04940, partial [Gammaproteobacteria bacterium]|nr:hypothetical protein [Gammaproteobacteria bacterium]
GSNVGIEVAGLSTVPAGKPIALTVYKPDGTTLSSTTASSPGGGFLNLSNLPVTGTYTVLIDPYYGATATMQVKLGATDLVLSGATLGALTANQDGSYNIPVTFTVTNQGNVTAKAVWFDMAYLSADATLDNADQNLSGYNYRNTDVAPGASYTVTVTHRTLSTTAPGNYTLFIKADGHGTQVGGANTNTGYLAEGNEVNNVQALTLTLPTKADLTVSSVTIGGIVKNANSSYSIPVTFTVTNQGSIAAKSYWFDLAYLSADATLDNADLNLSGYNYRNTDVAPGASYTVTVTYTTSTTTTAGAYRLFIKADGHGAQVGGTNTDSGNVTESNETNNAASVAITLP